ncbi:hypothetical protein BDR06DRAFT_986857 [Suillus hirtellus]|nr:hypothetical protein BDR06DRAFT_986857 [Suillus hirtellus]
MTVYRLMSWMNSSSNKKSKAEVARLVKDVMLADDFDLKHLEDFSVKKSLQELDNNTNKNKIEFPDDWAQADITISIPTKSKDDARLFTVPGFHFHPLVEVIHSAFADVQANAFHLSPFKYMWKDPLDSHQERVFNELYTSDSWLDAQDKLQKLPREPDTTHLANFGMAKAWFLYLYFGNLTKYAHSAPKSSTCHLVGFLPSLPDRVKDLLSSLPRISKSGITALHTHCRCKLFHACWDTLLDEKFLHAYKHGMVLKCADGVLRRIFPCIFTYSADYPENVLIATIKDMGSCPCPHCLTPKNVFTSLGLRKDMKSRLQNLRVYITTNVVRAREYIYQWGNTVDGTKVEEMLGEGSWVPVVNKFVEKLGALGLDPFRMLIVDFMHKCELGTWKALFTHLIRILSVLPGGNQLVAILDSRFRQVPSFGNGVIRIFTNNTSEMKRLAARDFEDILQCAIPVFEGLFPTDHNAIVQSLLYRFAQWHALAKLRMHSELTLCFFKNTFKDLSKQLREFREFTCAAFVTVELPKEKAARYRRFVKQAGSNDVPPESSGPRVKKFNLNTYKFHTMGDYVQTIQLFSTTDSFTTQIGELAHRALKAFYPLTSKLDPPKQLAKHECRSGISSSDYQPSPADSPAPSLFKDHHYISTNQNDPVSLFAFLQEHNGDPATKCFIPKLKDHILYRLNKLDVSHCDHIFMDKECSLVVIPNSTVYSVHTMQVHYMTYDMKREYDTINPRTHADVMVLSGETNPRHPYWYTHVLGIYHIDTWLKGQTKKQHLEVLYVRWLTPLVPSDYQSGMRHACLPKVAFIEESDHDAFGFLNPGQVIRGAHLIPAFTSGRGVSSLCRGTSFGRPSKEVDDWEEHYVRIFADRDMFLRYTHLGIGHSVALRKIIRDCFNNYESTAPTDAIEDSTRIDEGHAEDAGEQYMDDDLDKEESEDDLSEEESEDEHDGLEGGEDREEADEEFDDLHF